MEIKKGIQVKVIAGKDKGKTGEIIHKEYITARDKTYLNELISALKPYGLLEK